MEDQLEATATSRPDKTVARPGRWPWTWEEGSDSLCILKVEPLEFLESLDMCMKKKRKESKTNLRFLD